MAAKQQSHICSRCKGEFDSEQGYLEHECEKTGTTPTDPKHLGKAFEAVSKAALERGAKRQEKEHGHTHEEGSSEGDPVEL